jgi:Tol biopolymer transport system component
MNEKLGDLNIKIDEKNKIIEEIILKNTITKIDYDWSSDSKNIIFSRKDKVSNMNEIYKVEIKNQSLKQLTFNRVNDLQPKWNNKNSNIIFSSENEEILDLYSMLIDGSEQTRLTKNIEKFLDADW